MSWSSPPATEEPSSHLQIGGRPLAWSAGALFGLLFVVYLASVGIRASRGAGITGDEPFYLLTTQSLIQDGDLDLTNQYATRSYRVFFDHPDGLWRQSVPNHRGELLSPHEPALSVLLVPGFAAGGLLGAQLELVAIAALTFALAFVLTSRLTGRPAMAWIATLAVGLSATAFVYSSEVYPELPAGLALVGALLLLTREESVGTSRALGVVLALTAMSWFGVKYVLLAAVVAPVLLLRAEARARLASVVAGTVAGVVYVWFHLAVFDGLTPYGLSSAFAGGTEGEILGEHVAVADRVYRLWGVFIDRRFGIARWAPVLLLAVPGLVLAWRARGNSRVVSALVATQLAVATFLAITMMGWWFPGRTMATVLPLLGLPIAMVLARASGAWRVVFGLLAGLTVWITSALALAGHRGEVVIAVDPFGLGAAPWRLPAPLFPEYTAWGPDTYLLTAIWLAVGVAAARWAWRAAAREPATTPWRGCYAGVRPRVSPGIGDGTG
jgi:hypothetical protein